MLSNSLPIYLDFLKLDIEPCFNKHNYQAFFIDFLLFYDIEILSFSPVLCVREIWQFIRIDTSIGRLTFDLKRLLELQDIVNNI